MAFDPNREIKVQASQSADGTFTLRTKGLAARRRPELEIAGVPEPALHAAAGVLNEVAAYSVDRAEVLAGQTVGFTLAVEDSAEPPLVLVVRAAQVGSPSGGLWSRLTGGDKGVLRLLDPDGASSGNAPVTALATMLVHRGRVRRAKGDTDGAREELVAALATFTGDPARDVGRALRVDGDGTFNWQNHRAYLELAELEGPETGEVAYEKALARSHELSERELGATLDAIGGALEPVDVTRCAERILATNLAADASPLPAPAPDLALVRSPVWRRHEGQLVRPAAMIPAELVSLYYDGAARDGLARDGVSLARAALASLRERPARFAWRTRALRTFWVWDEAAFEPVPFDDVAAPLVSVVLAEIARCFRAGATKEEVEEHLHGRTGAALTSKLDELEVWQGDAMLRAMRAR